MTPAKKMKELISDIEWNISKHEQRMYYATLTTDVDDAEEALRYWKQFRDLVNSY